MTEEEYRTLTSHSVVHFKKDNPEKMTKERYTWEVMRVSTEGIMIDNEGMNPQWLDKYEVMEQLDIHVDSEKIERWRLDLKPDEENYWNGKINVTLEAFELRIITQALSTAWNEGTIDDWERNHILDLLNVDDN